MSIRSVGFVGLGIMGSRMARNLQRKGFGVTVWNRSRERTETFARDGFTVAESPAALAKSVDCFCSCVSDPAALREVALGDTGLLREAKKGQLFIDFSTVSPDFARELESSCSQRGIEFVEAPVTGSKLGAEKGTLVIMAGGSDGAIARAQPIFQAVGEKAIHVGKVGAGSQVKLAGNALLASMLEAVSEGMLLCSAAGVDPRKYLEVVQASGFRSPYFDFKGPALIKHDFETHFSVDLMFKDLMLFLDSAAKQRVPTPLVGAVKEIYQLARAQGKGQLDISAVISALEDLSGKKIG